MVISTIELCSGVGMLGEGLRAGLAHLGIEIRTVCHVEREAFAAAVLVSRMEEGSLDAAPIWSDLRTFDASAWRGKVDCIVAGFPCQDLSVAGKRAGLDGQRSGLFFEVCRIATDSGAQFMFLENVAGIASATATVMDEAEGELEERAAARVVGELADIGWHAEWLHLSASEVGASHGRERWFCLAWRMGHPGLQHQHIQQWKVWPKPARTEFAMANTSSVGLRGESNREQQPRGTNKSEFGFFAPRPDSTSWEWIIGASPWLSPALEPDFCGVVDGVAFSMDESRAARLRCCGNGVVALQAAAAFVVLAKRSGII